MISQQGVERVKNQGKVKSKKSSRKNQQKLQIYTCMKTKGFFYRHAWINSNPMLVYLINVRRMVQ